MSDAIPAWAERLRARFAHGELDVAMPRGEAVLRVPASRWLETARALREEAGFEVLIDLCGVDYLGYGSDEWDTEVSSEGFSRGVQGRNVGRFRYGEQPSQQAAEPAGEQAMPQPERRFGVTVQLLSIQHNQRLQLSCRTDDDALPVLDSLTGIWPGANWFEREAFDLFGIVFQGHPDLRRILTDYGFIGHPFRKDFPLIGNVEVRYDEARQRVVYEPVTSVEPRVGVPRVVRDDARYATAAGERQARAAGGAP